MARLRKDLFKHLMHQEIAFYDVTKTGELLSRLSEDTQIIKNAATTNLSEALRNVTTALIGVGFMFSSSWKLTCKKLLFSFFFVIYNKLNKLTCKKLTSCFMLYSVGTSSSSINLHCCEAIWALSP